LSIIGNATIAPTMTSPITNAVASLSASRASSMDSSKALSRVFRHCQLQNTWIVTGPASHVFCASSRPQRAVRASIRYVPGGNWPHGKWDVLSGMFSQECILMLSGTLQISSRLTPPVLSVSTKRYVAGLVTIGRWILRLTTSTTALSLSDTTAPTSGVPVTVAVFVKGAVTLSSEQA
jgi:hypothetical protein